MNKNYLVQIKGSYFNELPHNDGKRIIACLFDINPEFEIIENISQKYSEKYPHFFEKLIYNLANIKKNSLSDLACFLLNSTFKNIEISESLLLKLSEPMYFYRVLKVLEHNVQYISKEKLSNVILEMSKEKNFMWYSPNLDKLINYLSDDVKKIIVNINNQRYGSRVYKDWVQNEKRPEFLYNELTEDQLKSLPIAYRYYDDNYYNYNSFQRLAREIEPDLIKRYLNYFINRKTKFYYLEHIEFANLDKFQKELIYNIIDKINNKPFKYRDSIPKIVNSFNKVDDDIKIKILENNFSRKYGLISLLSNYNNQSNEIKLLFSSILNYSNNLKNIITALKQNISVLPSEVTNFILNSIGTSNLSTSSIFDILYNSSELNYELKLELLNIFFERAYEKINVLKLIIKYYDFISTKNKISIIAKLSEISEKKLIYNILINDLNDLPKQIALILIKTLLQAKEISKIYKFLETPDKLLIQDLLIILSKDNYYSRFIIWDLTKNLSKLDKQIINQLFENFTNVKNQRTLTTLLFGILKNEILINYINIDEVLLEISKIEEFKVNFSNIILSNLTKFKISIQETLIMNIFKSSNVIIGKNFIKLLRNYLVDLNEKEFLYELLLNFSSKDELSYELSKFLKDNFLFLKERFRNSLFEKILLSKRIHIDNVDIQLLKILKIYYDLIPDKITLQILEKSRIEYKNNYIDKINEIWN